MTLDLERLAQLREAVCGEYTAYLDPWERPTDEEVAFFNAAHAALSPDGCVTKELERLHRDLKDSRKDAAHLLDRSVRLSASARQYASVAGHDDDDLSSYQELMAVLNEVPK